MPTPPHKIKTNVLHNHHREVVWQTCGEVCVCSHVGLRGRSEKPLCCYIGTYNCMRGWRRVGYRVLSDETAQSQRSVHLWVVQLVKMKQYNWRSRVIPAKCSLDWLFLGDCEILNLRKRVIHGHLYCRRSATTGVFCVKVRLYCREKRTVGHNFLDTGNHPKRVACVSEKPQSEKINNILYVSTHPFNSG